MKAMILAAGRGERMRPRSDHTPKALLEVAGRPLIVHQIERLARAGIRDIVVNLSILGGQIETALGDGRRFGVALHYSHEGPMPLETGGGVYKALPLLGRAPFLVINADVWTGYPIATLLDKPRGIAHLVLVENRSHHPDGDFALEHGRVSLQYGPRFTFSGLGVYRSELFDECEAGCFPLAAVIRMAVSHGLVSGEYYRGEWHDIGTPEQLAALEARLAAVPT
jgi:N-acetyl-alpha-D-muramate 1-phosphate uridylyltransferase